MIILSVWLAVFVAVITLYFWRLYSSFSRHGVKNIKPVPIFGNMTKVVVRAEHVSDGLSKVYNEFPEERFVGRYEFLKELIVIRDLELIKKITVKDFEHFLDHRSLLNNSESYFSRNLLSLRGQEWKDMRSTLSPAFTSSKMRLMVPFMVEVGEQMMRSLHKIIKESKDGSIDVECKDLTTRYANDVIASCAFGLKVDSHNDKNNSFYHLGKETSTLNFSQILKTFFLATAPTLAKFIKMDFLSESSSSAFKTLVLGTMDNRELNNIFRPDMIHLLMEAKKGKLSHDDIKSNDRAAGFATVTESAIGKKDNNRVRDIELIKKVAIKDFEHFTDHRSFDGESFFKKTLFLMKGQEWKDMRSTLSPAFTSSKIRLMVPFMMEVGDQMILSLNKKLEDAKDDYVDIDFKDLTTRYANDVIASCAYGLKVDSQAEPNNQFYNMGKTLFDFNFVRMIMFFVLLNAPKVAKMLNWDIVPAAVRTFFTDLVLDTMKDRQQRNIIRPDMIHLLMEAKKGKLSHDDKPNDNSTGFATVEESSIGLRKVVNRGQEWKDMRSTLSPAFTSSKIRLMVPFMVEVGDQMIQSLNKEIEKSSDGYIDVDCKDLTTRYANDVIASCAFGLKVNSHAEKNNEFYIMGRRAANFGLREMFMFIFMVIAPKIVALLKWNLVPDKMKNYFTNLVLDTMKDRELRHIFRPDMIHLLMEAKKGFLDINLHKILGQLTHEDAKSNNDTTGFATVEESTTMIILLIWVAVLIAVVVLYLRQLYSTFSKHGIKHFKPIPLLGNMGSVILRKQHLAYSLLDLYNAFPDEKFVGRFEFINEAVMLRDLELVKKVCVKDFDYFVDHRNFGIDSFFARTLFLLQGQEWKDMRSTLSPAFTSSKIRLMVPFMVEVGDQMIESLKKRLKDSKEGYIDIDCKDLTTRYGNDVIASCAFGLKVDSQTEQNNQFYLMGKTVTNFNFFQMLKFFMMMNVPKIAKMFKWDIISDSVKNFFKNLVLDTMKEREMHKIIRPDMIHLLMEAKKGKLSHDDVQPNDDATGFATVDESSVGLRKVVNREITHDPLYYQATTLILTPWITRYSNDEIGSCAFGLKVDSQNEQNNEFYLKLFFVMNFRD
ncbi:hypothetical protein HF086_012124 [Spodoptera exigua]|uniref:unspecific monooxygenase n=1 Tax=Spodoptera exigua TaxID=7107 RepID=A0A922MYY5_SPOEX|nr:hypothetical protein HF086_012124 [Spodoptera exigua]